MTGLTSDAVVGVDRTTGGVPVVQARAARIPHVQDPGTTSGAGCGCWGRGEVASADERRQSQPAAASAGAFWPDLAPCGLTDQADHHHIRTCPDVYAHHSRLPHVSTLVPAPALDRTCAMRGVNLNQGVCVARSRRTKRWVCSGLTCGCN